MKTIVITGGTGFVGANLARVALHKNYNVHLLVRDTYKSWRITDIQKDLHLHKVSLTDEKQLITLFKKIRPNWFFHTAVFGAYSAQTDLAEMLQTNILGTTALLNAAKSVGFDAFINTGSSSEYGYQDHPTKESDWIDPNSHYAVTKAFTTQLCRFESLQNKLPITTLRLYSVYGPYEEPARLMPTLVRAALQQKLPPLVDPTIARDYIYIDDVVRAYFISATKAKQHFGSVYNVGTGKQTSLRQLVTKISKITPINEKPVWRSMEKRMWDTSIWVSNSNLIEKELGWKAKIEVEEGLKKMLVWQRKNSS
ncbi:MAG TPA: NAD-dependent epimerase/dehydratase family protein [Patescibacteria group bacterium]|nr:NAD-dependent epimerase/dehydratase family protein [Patescibacteria group bacterium]